MNNTDHASINPGSTTRIEQPRISLVSFATEVPISTLDDMIENKTSANPFDLRSVVGTITILSNCLVVWVGWGDSFHQYDDGSRKNLRPELWAGKPPQGQCTVAMPRATSYKGAFSDGLRELPSSQIIGGGSTDAQVLASQMASRLSARWSMAVFVSCQLTNEISTLSDESTSLPPLAAAAAEKEISKVVQLELAKQKR